MNAEIFIALCDHLEKEVPELRWIDEDEGQLNTAADIRPAVDFPCCLVDIQYPSCQDENETEQLVTANITLRIGFQPAGETNSKAPEAVRRKALERLDIIEKIQNCMQGWTAEEIISPVSRKSARSTVQANKVKVYTIVYGTTFMELQ
ncbi:hypothetical protein [Parabacteroides chinchillae]|uniref:Uncharacterized protein n=1 Tax=Parabacteroides chinchillae TaxID=871327 RepID=A0A8G2F1E5_9BACT|nr:hypothetical protein [Parabacteroides chinchillae]SEF86478.1 hypothetical protein SAMN05444001_108120 [Parabacteroides chinchillae]